MSVKEHSQHKYDVAVPQIIIYYVIKLIFASLLLIIIVFSSVLHYYSLIPKQLGVWYSFVTFVIRSVAAVGKIMIMTCHLWVIHFFVIFTVYTKYYKVLVSYQYGLENY